MNCHEAVSWRRGLGGYPLRLRAANGWTNSLVTKTLDITWYVLVFQSWGELDVIPLWQMQSERFLISRHFGTKQTINKSPGSRWSIFPDMNFESISNF